MAVVSQTRFPGVSYFGHHQDLLTPARLCSLDVASIDVDELDRVPILHHPGAGHPEVPPTTRTRAGASGRMHANELSGVRTNSIRPTPASHLPRRMPSSGL